MKTIASYREAYQAHIAQGKLEAHGIPVTLLDEQVATINWMYSNAIGGVRLQVPAEFEKKALQLLGEDHSGSLKSVVEDHPLSSKDQCPQCGSSDLKGGPYSRWSAVLSLLFMVPLLSRSKKWQCRTCDYKF